MADREREDRAEAERLRREEEKRRIQESIRRAEYDRKAKAVKALVQQMPLSRVQPPKRNSPMTPKNNSRLTELSQLGTPEQVKCFGIRRGH
jgi:hypothetical protein